MKTLIRSTAVALGIVMGTVGAASADALLEQARSFFEPIPMGTPELEDNAITPEKIELGKMLFFEPRLSKSGLISCNTCHNLGMGGADYQETSIGHGWAKGPRNAPTVLNSVFNLAQFWDGRAGDLAEQAKGPVQAGVEMSNTPEQVEKTLKSMPEYIQRFENVFPTDKNPVTFDNMAQAIEAFEATLVTPHSSFDKYLRGETSALNSNEKAGLKAFMDKGCVACHAGVNMGGTGYFAFGVVEAPDEELIGGDTGRYAVTELESDQGAFKSPSLRNIELTPPYFHSGKVWSLSEAVRIMGSAQLGISLTDQEVADITDFLEANTGIQPDVTYPILPAPTKGTPKPAWD